MILSDEEIMGLWILKIYRNTALTFGRGVRDKTLEGVVKWLDTVERPKAIPCDIDKYPHKAWDTAHSYGRRDGFNEAIQTIKQSLQEEVEK